MRAALYARHSGTAGIDNQLENCAQRARRSGWEIVERYADVGVPGTIPMRDRPQGARLLADAAAGKFEVVVVSHTTRVSRVEADLLDTLRLLHRYGVQAVLARCGRAIAAEPTLAFLAAVHPLRG